MFTDPRSCGEVGTFARKMRPERAGVEGLWLVLAATLDCENHNSGERYIEAFL